MKSDTGTEQPFPDDMAPVGQASRIQEIGSALVDAGVAAAASDAGRTAEEQWDRMGDRFAYMAVEQDPRQKQLDDYEVTGDFVEVRP